MRKMKQMAKQMPKSSDLKKNFHQNNKTKPSATSQNFSYLHFSKNHADCWYVLQRLGGSSLMQDKVFKLVH